ncbi:MAG: hypothetical protein HC769_05495 [Cyanobacteria bacterium CRU_2_1]|nr:hypothetical protein [Cyanobacteria bacterium RU_5_0]NJR58348.1 hypothetical protein [Cyanobacteria bacterium CRU_2_1]
MNYALRFVFFLLVSAVALAACGRLTSVSSNVQPSSPSPSVTPTSPSPSASAPSPTPPTQPQTYKEPGGAFEITLPSGYQYQPTETGVIFQSVDHAFRGEVVFGSAQGGKYNNEQLEAFLKQSYKTNLNLAELESKGSQEQPDGSLRVDWAGQDPQGNRLEAESFIEQRGNTIYILTLSGVNRSYSDYLKDAQAIVSSYKVRQQ